MHARIFYNRFMCDTEKQNSMHNYNIANTINSPAVHKLQHCQHPDVYMQAVSHSFVLQMELQTRLAYRFVLVFGYTACSIDYGHSLKNTKGISNFVNNWHNTYHNLSHSTGQLVENLIRTALVITHCSVQTTLLSIQLYSCLK